MITYEFMAGKGTPIFSVPEDRPVPLKIARSGDFVECPITLRLRHFSENILDEVQTKIEVAVKTMVRELNKELCNEQ